MNYKPLYDKAKELIEMFETNSTYNKSFPSYKRLTSELHQLEAEIKKEESQSLGPDWGDDPDQY